MTVIGHSADFCPWIGPVPERPTGLYTCGGFTGRGMVYVSLHLHLISVADFRRIFGSVLALTEMLLSDKEGDEARKVLLDSGLPEPFLFTKERFDSGMNTIMQSLGLTEAETEKVLMQSKAKL